MKKSMNKKATMKKITAVALAGILLVGGIPLSNEAFAKTKLKVSTTKINLKEGKQKVLLANQKVTFSTTNKKIAVVRKKKNRQCVVKAVKAGSCKIVVKNKKSTIKVSVKVTKNYPAGQVATATPVTQQQGTVTPVVTQTPVVTATAKAENSAAPTATAKVTQTPEQTSHEQSSPEQSPMATTTVKPTGYTEEPKETESVATQTPIVVETAEPTSTPKVVTQPAVVTDAATATKAASTTGTATVTLGSMKAETIQQSVNRLGFYLFDELEDEKNGKVISPYSVTNAMAMLINGADGETYNELKNALEIEDFATWNKEYSAYVKEHCNIEDTDMYNEYEADKKQPTLKVNNSFWYNDTNYSFDSAEQKAYMKTISDLYNAEANQMDFKNTNPKDQINAWVEENTNKMIKDLIQGEINQTCSNVMVNTVFMDARWKNCFDENITRKEKFYGTKDTTEVMMMNSSESEYYRYYNNDSLKMLSIPFNDYENGLEMDIIMQADDDQKNAIEQWKSCSVTEKENLLKQLDDADVPAYGVDVTMPKFTMEYGVVELNTALKKLGLNECFDQNKAEFPAIRGENKDNIFVEDVLHKTKIEVKENGVTAAAATAIIMAVGCLPGTPAPRYPVKFKVDHPFVYVIKDKTGMIYFMGQVSDLSASK